MDWCSETVEAAQWLSEPEDFVLNKIRWEQGSNLRGKIPLDFKSSALTTRPSQPVLLCIDWDSEKPEVETILYSFWCHIGYAWLRATQGVCIVWSTVYAWSLTPC